MKLSAIKPYYSFIYLFLSILGLSGLFFNYLSPSIFCLLVVFHMLVLLIIDVFAVEVSVVSSLVLMTFGSSVAQDPFLTTSKSVSGFSESTVFIVAALFVVAKGVQNAGIIHSFFKNVLGQSVSLRRMYLRLAVSLIPLSAFMNNTPIVAIFVPYMREWALKNNLSPSKILIPVSYFTIFGGMLTIIGTSTNLVVQGLVEKVGISVGFWEPFRVALPCAMVGVLYMITIGKSILPNHKDLLENTKEELKSYVFVLEVLPESPYHLKSILDSGLRDIEDCFLFEVRRGTDAYTAVKGTFVLKEGDMLYFKGNHHHILNLVSRPGLRVPGQQNELNIGTNAQTQYLEVSVAANSPLIGKTIDEVWFNRTYDATVLALHQNGEKVENNISKVALKAGDTLVLLAGKGFRRIWQNSNVFNFVTPLREDLGKGNFFWFALVSLVLMVLVPEIPHIGFLHSYMPWFPEIPLILSSAVCCTLFIVFQLVEKNSLTRLVDWSVLLVIGSAFGISHALQDSGAAQLIGDLVIRMSGSHSPMIALVLVYLGANILTEMITNNAAAAIFIPLALAVANALHVSPMPFIMAVMIAASSSYSTPFGYQTNMMVYGPGNYKFLDYLKVGLPLNGIYFILSMLLIPMIWSF